MGERREPPDEPITESLTVLRPDAERTALAFHARLLELAACSTAEEAKFAFFAKVQSLVRDFVIAKKPEKSLLTDSEVDQ